MWDEIEARKQILLIKGQLVEQRCTGGDHEVLFGALKSPGGGGGLAKVADDMVGG